MTDITVKYSSVTTVMAQTGLNVAAEGAAGACGGPGNRTPAQVVATWDDYDDFVRVPIAFVLTKKKLRRVKPVKEVNGFTWGTYIYYANLVIDLEEDRGERRTYTRFCNLPKDLCVQLEEVAEKVWKETGRINDVVEAVESAAESLYD